MVRVLGVLAGLLWVAGIVMLVLNIAVLPDASETRHRDLILIQPLPKDWLLLATGLVGVAGVLTAVMALTGRRR